MPGTALALAVRGGHLVIVDWLLEQGQASATEGGNGPSPVELASTAGDSGVLLRLLAVESPGRETLGRLRALQRISAIMGLVGAQQGTTTNVRHCCDSCM